MPQFKYVEMICKLDLEKTIDKIPGEGICVESIKDIDPEILFECYTKTFNQSDANFYQHQTEKERKLYFDKELGFPEVLQLNASGVYKSSNEIIGFALVMPYMENNYHISCMCILPEYQSLGIGKSMLNRIKISALENGCRSLTLGTEPDMKAFHFYRKYGFIVTQEHIVEI